MGSGGWLHKGKVLAPFMFVVLYENLSTLFYFLCYKLACFEKMELKKERPNYLHFIDSDGRVSFAYVPVRDQNLVVRGKNYRLIG